ncbi:DUF4097 family beta strand repeat-containing protein [Streptomyces hebeiensis]
MATRRRRIRTLLAAGGAVVLGVCVGGCGTADASDAPVERKSFALNGKTLTIDAENAGVELVPADVAEVEVTRQVDGWVFMGSGPDARWEMRNDTLRLGVRCGGVASHCAARHTVKVPRGVAVTVAADNGDTTATGFVTALRLTSDNGAVTVRDARGPLSLKTENGKISAKGVASKKVAATSDNGSVRLAFTAVPDLVETVGENGSVTIELPTSQASYAVRAASENGSVDVDVPTASNSSHTVKARTDNGKITVRPAN